MHQTNNTLPEDVWNNALEDFKTHLRFKSISTDSAYKQDVADCGAWLHAKFESMGLETQTYPTAGHPIVVGRTKADPNKKTVLIYGHYDVQPVDPLHLWHSDPFEPVIKDGKIWGRGTTDNKGQHLALILGVEKYLNEHEGELPVNVIFLIEGEEEIGSPNLKPFLEKHKEQFACDIIAVSDTGMVARNTPTLGYGLRGIACLEITVNAANADLHSGLYGGMVANPAQVVAKLISSLHDSNGKVAIDGFYDDVVELETWEKDMWTTVPDMDDTSLKTLLGVDELVGEAGYTPVERVWGRPTAEVNGIYGGYQGEGSKTVIPANAGAKLSFRLVPQMQPDIILAQAKAHLEQHCPAGVTLDIELGHSGNSYMCDPHSEFGKAGQEALRKTFNAEPVLIREGGSIPIIADFKEVLGTDSLLLGLALPDCQIHSPNENFHLANFRYGIVLVQNLLDELA